MKIITVSREFGSGGRELGKRLADLLGFDYYDKEIIAQIAKNKGLDENYVQDALENHGWQNYQLTFRNTFVSLNTFKVTHTDLLIEQKEVIEQIAKLGRDCIIVGRNADVILENYHPFNIFVCADMEAKIKRCINHAREGEDTSEKEMMKKIKRIDKNRARTRELITDSPFGNSSGYSLTVNSTGWEIKKLAVALSNFIKEYYQNKENK